MALIQIVPTPAPPPPPPGLTIDNEIGILIIAAIIIGIATIMKQIRIEQSKN